MSSLAAMRAVVANREFALLWSGQTISQFGDGILSVALPLLVLRITSNATDLGLVVAARLVPTVVFLLLGGALSDRVSRRWAMLVSDANRAAITATLGLLALTGRLDLGELLVGSILFGIFDALFYPASTALLPELIAAESLTAGNSLSRFSGALAGGLVGPVVGGVASSTIGTSWPLIIDAATFVISALFLVVMHPTPTPPVSGKSMVSEVLEGLAYCRGTPWISWTIGVAGVANALVFSPAVILLPLLFKRVLHAANWMVGVGFAAIGLGGLVGAALMAVLPNPRARVRTMWMAWSIAPLLAIVFGLTRSAWWASFVVFIVGGFTMVGNILWQALLQSEVPTDILGRVSSVDWMVSLGLSPVGVAAAGLVSGVVGVRATIIVPALMMVVLSLVPLVLVRSITAVDRRPSPREEPGATA